MMKMKVMKIVGVFLIFILTTNTAALASTIRCCPLCHSTTGIYQILSLRCAFSAEAIQSIPLKIRGQGTQAGLGSGSYDYSVVPVQTRIQKIKSVHGTRNLLTPDDVIIIARPTYMTLNSIRVVSIPIFKISSNTLSDIFIPPRASL
jgi:hypothetical protein